MKDSRRSPDQRSAGPIGARRARRRNLKEAIFAHPTLAEGLTNVFLALDG